MRFATLAVFLLLLPRAGVAAAVPADITPYTAFAWTAPNPPLTHVVGIIRYQSSSDPSHIAAALNKLPAGQRFLLRWESNDNHFWHNPADQLPDPESAATQPANPHRYQGPWIDNGAAAEAAFESRFAAALKQHSATPDFLVLDTEFGISTYDMTEPHLRAIMADARWPALAKRFNIHGTAGLIRTINNPNAQAFNLAMQVTTAHYFRAGYFEPWKTIFPNIHASDFGDGVLDAAAAQQAPDDMGCIQPMALPMHGDTQSPYCYAWVHDLAKSPAGQGADFTKPMPILCWLTSMVRAYAKSPQPILPWLAAKSWTDGHVPIVNSPYQDELLFHICLSAGCTEILFFNPDSPTADNQAIDHDLADLQRQTNNSPTLAPLTTAAVPYRSAILISGATCADGRRIYRLTIWPTLPTPRQLRVSLPGEKTACLVIVPSDQPGVWIHH